MPLKVLIISHGHPQLSRGGAEMASYRLFDAMRRQPDIDCVYLAWTDDPAFRRDGSPFRPFRGRPDEFVFYADSFSPFRFSQQSATFIDWYRRLIEQLQPDIVHFHHYYQIGVELIVVTRETRPQAKIVMTLHEFLAICHHYGQMVKIGTNELCTASSPGDCAACFPAISPDRFAVREEFIKSHFQKIDRFIAPSRLLRDRYIAWGLPAEQIELIENGMEPMRPPPPRPLAAGERRGVFGFFGQINPFKGLRVLLQAMDALARFPENAAEGIRLVIHGAYLELNPPAYVAEIRALLELTAARVEFAGPYDPTELGRLMADVDWVVVPSIWWENSPVVIQEAYAHRRPVICSDIGGMAEKVRSGRDGFHFAVANPRHLANLMMRLTGDPDIWDRLQRTIQQPASIAQSLAAHLALYRDDAFVSGASR